MTNFFASIILVSLLLPAGFNFLREKTVDYSYGALVSSHPPGPERIANQSLGLKTTAKSILVIDDASGALLYNKNPAAILPVASISKLITALVILDTNPDWNKVVEITEADQRDGGIVYLLAGEEVTVKDLFYLMLVSSANEAAAALARSSGLTDFSQAMNKKAGELGMVISYFIDPSGLDPANVSSPDDLVKLARAAFSRPEITEALLTAEYPFVVLNNKRQGEIKNKDQLLDSFFANDGYEIIGAKTGYLDEAGYCLLFQIKKKDGPSLTLVILGALTITDRWQEAKGLVEWAFGNYRWGND